MGRTWQACALLVLLVLLVLLGCDRAKPPEPVPAREVAVPAPAQEKSKARPVPAGPLSDSAVYLEFGVYGDRELRALAEKLAAEQLPDVPRVREPTRDTPMPWLSFQVPAIADYAPPDEQRLRYAGKGLDEADGKRLSAATHALILRARAPAERAAAVHRGVLAIVAKLAARVNGFPWDEETRQAFSRAQWAEDRTSWQSGVPNVSRHVTMHAYRDGELIRIVTLGMAKFGYPDLVVDQVASGGTSSVGNLINLAAQTLVEQGGLAKAGTLEVSLDKIVHPDVKAQQDSDIYPNAERHASIAVAFVEPDEGDAENRLIELSFPAQAGEAVQAAQVRAVTRVYGSSDEMVFVKQDDPEVLAASARARKELRALKAKFKQGPPFNEQLVVKAPFRTPDDGTEWMWVELVRWEGKTIHGVLVNEPFEVPELKVGARVEVAEDSVFDYIHRRADGSQAGDLTTAVIDKRGVDRRKK